MTEEKPASAEFRVVDKRRFNSEGEAKSSSADIDSEMSSAGKPDSSSDTQQRHVAGRHAAERSNNSDFNKSSRAVNRSVASDADYEHQTEPAGPGEEHRVDFPSFLVSLATQGFVMMGEVPHPETQQTVTNLDAAKETIDILAMLEEKTQGNLSSEEQKLLAELLTALRLTFVKKIEHRK
jgi:hypothetical protein